MTGKNSKVDLDLSELMPHAVRVKAGEAFYEITTDLPPALASRIARWFAGYGESLHRNGADLEEDELWAMVAQVLGSSEEQARALGFAASMQLLSFLTRPFQSLARTMRLSVAPSSSPSPMEAP